MNWLPLFVILCIISTFVGALIVNPLFKKDEVRAALFAVTYFLAIGFLAGVVSLTQVRADLHRSLAEVHQDLQREQDRNSRLIERAREEERRR